MLICSGKEKFLRTEFDDYTVVLKDRNIRTLGAGSASRRAFSLLGVINMEKFSKVKDFAHGRVIHAARHYCHLIYFGLVFFEGHGLYAIMGAVLFVISVPAVFFGEEV